MSLSDIKNNLEISIENNNNEEINRNIKYKEDNSSILNQNYLSPNNKDISNSTVYKIKNNENNNYPYYFKYSNSNVGDDFHKTKKYYNNYNNDNKYDFINKYENKIELENKMNSDDNYKIDYNNYNNYNNYNSWYEKFKNSKIYNNKRENEKIIQTNEYDEYAELKKNKIIFNRNDFWLNKELNNIMDLLKNINTNNSSEENFFIKNKYSELFK